MRRSRRRMSLWWQQYPSNRTRWPVAAVSAMGHQPTFVAHFPEWKLKLWSGSIRCASLGRPLWSRALRPSADCQARRLAPKDEGPHARERTEVKLLRRELIKAEDDAVE